MGGAVARGMAGLERVTLSTPHPDNSDMGGVSLMTDNRAAVKGADLVIVAVKPRVLPGVVAEIAPCLDPDTEVCAIVAGVSGENLRGMFGARSPRTLSIAMPNTAMIAGESMTFVVTVMGRPDLTLEVFSHLGAVEEIDERLLPAAMALASCGIAYALRYVRAATEGGVELGLRASEAQRAVAQTLRGAAALLEREGAHAETEIDKVTTPGGFTIRGLNAMERAGFTNAVIEGLKASVK